MTDRPPIFRPEALENQERRGRPGDVLRAAPRWTSWFFYGLIFMVLAALVAASVVRIERYARGPTAIDDRGRVVVLLPVSLAPRVAPGSRVEWGTSTARVISSGAAVIYPSDARRRYSVEITTPSAVVVTSATSVTPGGTARVVVESGPVILQLVPGLDALFGGQDA